MEKNYDASVDIWSAGCIFAEMLNCLQNDSTQNLKDRILFPGNSCYPLSPKESKHFDSEDEEEVEYKISKKDQMKYICRILGTPSSTDRSFISDEAATNYMDIVCKHRHTNKLSQYFSKAKPECIQLLSGMLEFNPYLRLTAKEALAHPIFNEIRLSHFEKPSPVKITQEIY